MPPIFRWQYPRPYLNARLHGIASYIIYTLPYDYSWHSDVHTKVQMYMRNSDIYCSDVLTKVQMYIRNSGEQFRCTYEIQMYISDVASYTYESSNVHSSDVATYKYKDIAIYSSLSSEIHNY